VIPKPIRYTSHAAARLKERRITRQQVRWLLAQGVRERNYTAGDVQRWSCRGYLGTHEAAVIFTETATVITVITVMWIE
jgi:hypothetical protein